MMADTQCTIVIPTYNRPEYLSRVLRYYDHVCLGSRIIVTDSSEPGIQVLNRDVIRSHPSLSILYLSHPTSAEAFGGLEKKLVDALHHCETKYCVVCADDDFITRSGMDRSVEFLECNPDFVVAHGDYLYFRTYTSSNSRKRLLWIPVYEDRSLTAQEAELRLLTHLSNYPGDTTFYAVHRTETLKCILQQVVDAGLHSVVFRELYSTGITVLYGKTRYMDVFYSAKDSQSTRQHSVPDLDSLKETEEYREEYARFRHALSPVVAQCAGLPPNECETIVANAMSGFLDRLDSSKQLPLFARSIVTARDLARHRGLGWIYKGTRKAYRGVLKNALRLLKEFHQNRIAQFRIGVEGRISWTNYHEFTDINGFLLSDYCGMLDTSGDIVAADCCKAETRT